MRIGIVGYGNLGKAVEDLAKKDSRFTIVGVFSRRKVEAKSPTYSISEAEHFKGKIDVMVMCGGSERDLLTQTPEFAKNFNVIDTFDTHPLTLKHFENVNKVCAENQTSAIVSAGWDPGLFSIFRVLFNELFDNVNCFYGRGVSLGHTNALKRLDNVVDARQYTIPNKKALKQARQGKKITTYKHLRECYVVTKENKSTMTNKINSIPNYFLGEKTKIHYVGHKKLLKKHHAFEHKGEIIGTTLSKELNSFLDLKIKMSSNPYFTAKIVLSYCFALKRISDAGVHKAYSPMQIPVSWLLSCTAKDLIEKFC